MSYLGQLDRVNTGESIKSIDFDWRNPYSASKLSKAVRSKNLNLVKKLIKGGSALDAPDNRGWTPLHEASTCDELVPIAKVLISAGAYIEHKTVDGETPLIIACKNGAENIVKILIKNHCVVDTQNNEYLTPLHIACCHQNKNIIRLLLNKGAALDAKDDEERTPLYLALENVNTVALKILIEAGADLNGRDFFFRTPLQYSCMVGNLEIFNMLIDILGHDKAVIDQQTPEGWTLLMEAAQYKNYLIVERLLELGADTTLADNRNLLALHIAAHSERFNLLQLFMDHTPKAAIETHSTFRNKIKGMTHYRSLPCLIIDKKEFDGLELLYRSDLSEDVLKCPVQMGNHLVSPISFLLLYAHACDNNTKRKFLKFLLEYDFLLDPVYKLEDCYNSSYLVDNEIKVISPIEAALMMHTKNDQEDCLCDTFLSMILAKGVSPDKIPANLINCIAPIEMYLFLKALQFSCSDGLDLLFKYSDKTEPFDFVEGLVMNVVNEKHVPTTHETKIISHILSKCVYDSRINKLTMVVTNKTNSLEGFSWWGKLAPIKDMLVQACRVSSLKKHCRSAIRNHVHQVTTPPSNYTFREFINNMALPAYIIRYLLYEIDF